MSTQAEQLARRVERGFGVHATWSQAQRITGVGRKELTKRAKAKAGELDADLDRQWVSFKVGEFRVAMSRQIGRWQVRVTPPKELTA